MCGIVGYTGKQQASPILFNCLKKLEYRGYDSCGIAIITEKVDVCKDVVRVDALNKTCPALNGHTGIGHTRWATHGQPSMINAHPHVDCSGKIAVVHNGVIANYQELKRQLLAEGHIFLSETDTEVLPHLIEKYFQGDLVKAVQKALSIIEGSYAIIVAMAGSNQIIVAKKDSPLIIGIGDRGNFVASDAPALLDYTNRVIYLDDGDIASITEQTINIFNNGQQIKREEQKILWGVEEAQKGGYEHYMLKEIREQPRVIRNTLMEYNRNSDTIQGLTELRDNGHTSMLMLACGTSYHASLVGKYAIEELLGIPVRAELASEFNYYSRPLAKTLAIAITQSGETADTVKAMKKVKEIGCSVLAITNVVGSSATRAANQTIYTRAGPEISVAATKSFIAQIMSLYWLAIVYSKTDNARLSHLRSELRQLPTKVQNILDEESPILEYAESLSKYENAFFIGRGINYPIALEGALKLKEISYIHAEGAAAGETKHGPLALLGSLTPVIALITRDKTHDAMLTSIKEIKARGAPVVAIAEEGDDEVNNFADSVIYVPSTDPLFSPVMNVVILQLLAYYTAKKRGCPIDFPRNLAKSVTVE
jgi:glutamine---fructose-6-phosphate transaminase (isomerizing)